MRELEFWFTHLVLCEFNSCTVLCLVTQSCLTIFDPMDCSPRGSSVHGGSPGKNTGVGCHALLQEIFPAQRSKPRPSTLWVDSLPSELPGKPKNTGVGSPSLLQGIFSAQGSKPRPSTLWVDSLPSELPEKPKNTGVGGPSLLQGIFPTQELNRGLLHSRWILYQLSYQGSTCEPLYNLDLMWKWTQQGISCVESYCLLTTLLFHPSPSPFQGWSSISSGTDLSVDLLPTYPVLFCGPSGVWSPLSVTRPDSIQGGSSS